jgi:bifunctional polynucleotide phosphatase/kinase
MNPEERVLLPKQAFTGFISRYQRPELAEGFQDITEISFEVRMLEESLSAAEHNLC